MQRIKVSCGGGTQFHGRPIPVNAVYGNIRGRDYICSNFHAISGSYPLFVYDNKRGLWKSTISVNFPAIHAVIVNHVKSAATLEVGAMPTKTRDKKAAFYSRKKREFQEMRREREKQERFERFCAAQVPERRVQSEYIFRSKPVNAQAGIEDERFFEYTGKPYDVISRNEGEFLPAFDTGTNNIIRSVQDIEGEIFDLPRDRMKMNAKDYKPDERPEYMKYSGPVTKKYEFKLYGA